MSKVSSPEIDDELFNEVYGKEYTAPARPTVGSARNTSGKRPHIEEEKNGKSDDDEDMALDPNAVPTDFTSREARVREAKAKAMEKNWKKRKEEEFICKLCGEAGHFTQGCPSTLGANQKMADCFQRVPARDKQVRSLFTDKVISQIEKDVGCKLKMDEKFLIVSGKDGLILSKGIDAVYKLIQYDKNKSSTSSHRSRSRSPVDIPRSQSPVCAPKCRSPARAPRPRSPARAPRPRSPAHAPRPRSPAHASRPRSPARAPRPRSPARSSRSKSPIHVKKPIDRHSASHSSIRNPAHLRGRSLNQDIAARDQVHGHIQTLSEDSPYGRAYANGGSRGHLSRSRSPSHSSFRHDHNSFDEHNRSLGMAETDNWNLDRQGNKLQPEQVVDYPNPQNLEEAELEFKREYMEISRIRDQEEDEENLKHRERIQGLREDHIKKLKTTKNMHMKQWEEFLQLDIQKQHQLAHHNAHNQQAYMEYNQSRGPQYIMRGTNSPINSKLQPSYPSEEYSAARQHDLYRGSVQSQINDEPGRMHG